MSELAFSTAKSKLGPGSVMTWSSPAMTLTLSGMEVEPESVRLGKAIVRSVNTPVGGSATTGVAQRPTHVEGSFPEVGFGLGEGTGFGPEPVNVLVRAKGLPWAYTFTSTGKVSITGTEQLALEVEVEGSEISCVYTAPKITGKYVVGGPVQVDVHQTFKKANKKTGRHGPGCQTKAVFEGKLSFTADEEVVDSQVL